MSKTKMTTSLIVAIFALVACESTPQSGTPSSGGVVTTPPVSNPVGSFQSSGNTVLDLWRYEFAQRAYGRGHSVEIIRSVLDGIEPMNIFLQQSSTAAQVTVKLC